MGCLYCSGYKTVWAPGLELKQVRPQAGEGLEAKQARPQARPQEWPQAREGLEAKQAWPPAR